MSSGKTRSGIVAQMQLLLFVLLFMGCVVDEVVALSAPPPSNDTQLAVILTIGGVFQNFNPKLAVIDPAVMSNQHHQGDSINTHQYSSSYICSFFFSDWHSHHARCDTKYNRLSHLVSTQYLLIGSEFVR